MRLQVLKRNEIVCGTLASTILIPAGTEDEFIPSCHQKQAGKIFANAGYKQYGDCAHNYFIGNAIDVFLRASHFSRTIYLSEKMAKVNLF